MAETPTNGPKRVTATRVQSLGERQADTVSQAMAATTAVRQTSDVDLARQIAAAQETDPDAAAAARMGVSADQDPSLIIPEPMPNPDEEVASAGVHRTDEERRDASQQAAVAEHIREIDADANHPLRGAAGRNRLSFGTRTARLTAPSRPGFHRHWFNEIAGRVDRALRAGYKIVNDTDGKPMRRTVGRLEGGAAMYAFYMEIPVAWYVEDMRAAKKPVDELERTIKAGKLGATEHMYVPKSGIEFEEEVGGDFHPRT